MIDHFKNFRIWQQYFRSNLIGPILQSVLAVKQTKDLKKKASMKKYVCLDVPKPNNIMRHESNSEHSTPLATFPRGTGCKIQHIDCKIIFGNKM